MPLPADRCAWPSLLVSARTQPSTPLPLMSTCEATRGGETDCNLTVPRARRSGRSAPGSARLATAAVCARCALECAQTIRDIIKPEAVHHRRIDQDVIYQ